VVNSGHPQFKLFNDMASEWREEAIQEAKQIENMSNSELEEWRQGKIQQGVTQAKAISLIIPVGGGVGLAARLSLWANRFAYPLKYARLGRLQPYNPVTGRYLSSSSLYTNGEYLIYRSTPYLNGAADFLSSTLPGIPAANYYGAAGMATGLVISPEKWTR
jgi:hypothetical protein